MQLGNEPLIMALKNALFVSHRRMKYRRYAIAIKIISKYSESVIYVELCYKSVRLPRALGPRRKYGSNDHTLMQQGRAAPKIL